MYQKIEIEEFCNRIVRDRSLRINKDLLTGICAQAMQAVDLLEAIRLSQPAPEQAPEVLPDTQLDGLNADEMSLDEILDTPLSSVPDSGTLVAGGNPECDTQIPKSKQQSSSKAKPPQR